MAFSKKSLLKFFRFFPLNDKSSNVSTNKKQVNLKSQFIKYKLELYIICKLNYFFLYINNHDMLLILLVFYYKNSLCSALNISIKILFKTYVFYL